MSDEQTTTADVDNADAQEPLIQVAMVARALGVDAGATGDDVIGFIGSMREQLAGAVSAEDHAAIVAERDTLAKQLQEVTASYQVKARSRSSGSKARKIGPVDAPTPEDLAAAIGGDVELVFSDGKKEITGIDPRVVTGAPAWERHPGGWMLRDRVLLSGPAPGEAAYAVAGVGLLVDGRQVAWCQLFDPLSVPPGGTSELRNSIIF